MRSVFIDTLLCLLLASTDIKSAVFFLEGVFHNLYTVLGINVDGPFPIPNFCNENDPGSDGILDPWAEIHPYLASFKIREEACEVAAVT